MNVKSIYKGSLVFIAALGMSVAARAGELTIVGTGDGLDMLRAVAVAYVSQNPDVKLSVPPSIGSGGGIAAVGAGTERMGRVARPLKPSEYESGLAYLPLARIPSAIIVHPSTGVTELTSAQLVDVYSGRAKSWAEFGGADIKIKVVRREDSDSTLQILRNTMPGWADMEITSRSKTAVTTQDALDTVRVVEGAIGFGPYSRALELDTTVLRIDGRAPTDEGYPSAVELALIYKEDSIDAEMKSFLDFVRSPETARIIENYGGVPVIRTAARDSSDLVPESATVHASVAADRQGDPSTGTVAVPTAQ